MEHWKKKAEQLLSEKLERKIIIDKSIPIGGGCINECFECQTSAGKFFVKKNDAKKYPKMFESEKKGLELLNAAMEGIAPRVIGVSEHKDESEEDKMILILEWIEKGNASKEFLNDFAKKLAALHQMTSESFGLDHDNYIGSLPQGNSSLNDWSSFFVLRRIEPQLKMAIDDGKLSREIHRSFEKLFNKLEEIFPKEKPALIHGDLWSGNYLIASDGWMRLIDPSVYYGHREMDLSMMKLFGGFDSSFFRFYAEYFPQEYGFEKRADIYNLYPLLVHTNLFGWHYGNDVQKIIQRVVE